VQIVLRVALNACFAITHQRDIEIDYDLDFRNINTAGEHICSNNHCNLARAEHLDHFVSLLTLHAAEDDHYLKLRLSQLIKEHLGKTFAVDKNDGLGHRAHFKHALNELRFLALVASVAELLDVVQLKQLFANVDLLGFFDYFADGLLDLLRVGGTEENVLYLLRKFFDVFRVDFFDRVDFLFLLEEKVSLVNDNALEL